MKAEQTQVIRVYLRYQSPEDVELWQRLQADRERGRAMSETVRDALRAYYFEPSPAPELDAVGSELTAIGDTLAALTHEVQRLRDIAAELDAARAQNAELRALLVAATYGDKHMRRAAADAARALSNGNGHS